jgi:hypothetical protein
MTTWVIASNPATYNAEGSLESNGQMDWVTNNKFELGDVVYIYEVIPPRGRGGIVYKLEVVADDITMATKIDDRKFWGGGVYPKDLDSFPRIYRLKLVGEAEDGVIALKRLKARGFTAPQGLANSLDTNPALIEYIEDFIV